jgi:hypothetical protein
LLACRPLLVLALKAPTLAQQCRARRSNTYEPSDVKAALEYYSNGVGDMPYEADFAVNRFGTEDAAFFDDIDNNEGYAASEYLSVGIEEAAPKMKQVGSS